MNESLLNNLKEEIISLKYNKKMVVDISFVSKEEIKELNFNYRNINKPTDVLSFSMKEGDFPECSKDLLGDVIICEDIVRENAVNNKVSFQEERLRVIIHGLLHIIGYNHDDKDGEKEMFNLQEKYLKKFQCRTGVCS
ncbi:MAG: rRNA maturation RNase YbeY [Candidatus Muiribacteriota bacterium]